MELSATHHMRHALELAQRGLRSVAPNPMVGAVVTHDNIVIGQGYHQRCGGPHAEVEAINSIKQLDLLPYSTLYVTLEPCSHHGRTPPCVDLILRSKIPQVVIGCLDSNPLVSGQGAKRLREAGVDVTTAVLEPECREVNRRFFVFHEKKRPYIILKWAETADGFMAPEDKIQRWISSEASRSLVHEWRSDEQAIMIGTDTALIDNPQLNSRISTPRHPLRVILDRSLRLPPTLKVFDGSQPTLVLNTISERTEGLTEWVRIDTTQEFLSKTFDMLYQRGILSIIIEGGGKLLNSLLEQNLWDEARIFRSPTKFGRGLPSPQITGTKIDEKVVGTDLLLVLRQQPHAR